MPPPSPEALVPPEPAARGYFVTAAPDGAGARFLDALRDVLADCFEPWQELNRSGVVVFYSFGDVRCCGEHHLSVMLWRGSDRGPRPSDGIHILEVPELLFDLTLQKIDVQGAPVQVIRLGREFANYPDALRGFAKQFAERYMKQRFNGNGNR